MWEAVAAAQLVTRETDGCDAGGASVAAVLPLRHYCSSDAVTTKKAGRRPINTFDTRILQESDGLRRKVCLGLDLPTLRGRASASPQQPACPQFRRSSIYEAADTRYDNTPRIAGVPNVNSD
jgi:hypothetical protein